LSLERSIIEVLGFGAPGTTPNQRRKSRLVEEVRSGSKERSKDRKGLHGNTGEPNFSTRKMVNKESPYPKSPIPLGKYRHLVRSKEKHGIEVVFRARETEGKKKEEGSLSILVVLTDTWGIKPKKPRLGKEDAWNWNCNWGTFNGSKTLRKVSTIELQIAERASKHKGEALHSLNQFIDESLLERSYKQLNKNSASGVDGENWYEFGIAAQVRIPELVRKFKTGEYRAPQIRRVYIPKGEGEKRPLGIPTIEDKVLQAGVRQVLEPIYEKEFKDFSYAFRPNARPIRLLIIWAGK
jgi:hypothetical protein